MMHRYYVDGEQCSEREAARMLESYALQGFAPEETLEHARCELEREGYVNLNGLALERVTLEVDR